MMMMISSHYAGLIKAQDWLGDSALRLPQKDRQTMRQDPIVGSFDIPQPV